MPRFLILTLFLLSSLTTSAQDFLFGADLSYVNEMEDCGVVYRENNVPQDPYETFAGHNCGLARLRLWHTPSWYDTLNQGQRYSNLPDVKRSIGRAREAGMQVLLDFHFSDFWADPSRQWAPAAWQHITNDLPLLKDSLYHYTYSTLMELHQEGLLPEMVQVGNETNKGILLSYEENEAGWVLDWERNAQLFNTAIQAVREVENVTAQKIQVALHVAGPSPALWFYEQFIENGVTDFDIMGLSYYWAWHQPTTIQETGQIIAELRSRYPGYEVMVFETGYIWTTGHNDDAQNIISEGHPDYLPISPEMQKQWLIDLTQEVMARGGRGVVYWEPAWVSSPCYTPWGQGSHQEHATFFDFDNNLLPEGGIGWMEHDYKLVNSTDNPLTNFPISIQWEPAQREILIRWDGEDDMPAMEIAVFNSGGSKMAQHALRPALREQRAPLPQIPAGMYFATISYKGRVVVQEGILLRQ